MQICREICKYVPVMLGEGIWYRWLAELALPVCHKTTLCVANGACTGLLSQIPLPGMSQPSWGHGGGALGLNWELYIEQ